MDDMDDFPKFEITDHFIENCSFYRGPEFPCLRVRLELFRRISYYILRIYGPSFLLTLTSFVGFWIPAVGYPARVRIFLFLLFISYCTNVTNIHNLCVEQLRSQLVLHLFWPWLHSKCR